MIRTFATSAGQKMRRELSRRPSMYRATDTRVSLRQHLFGTPAESSPLRTPNGKSAAVKLAFMVSGVSLLGSSLIYTAIMHPDVRFDKQERQKTIRNNHNKARRFASHRKLSSHNNH